MRQLNIACSDCALYTVYIQFNISSAFRWTYVVYIATLKRHPRYLIQYLLFFLNTFFSVNIFLSFLIGANDDDEDGVNHTRKRNFVFYFIVQRHECTLPTKYITTKVDLTKVDTQYVC